MLAVKISHQYTKHEILDEVPEHRVLRPRGLRRAGRGRDVLRRPRRQRSTRVAGRDARRAGPGPEHATTRYRNPTGATAAGTRSSTAMATYGYLSAADRGPAEGQPIDAAHGGAPARRRRRTSSATSTSSCSTSTGTRRRSPAACGSPPPSTWRCSGPPNAPSRRTCRRPATRRPRSSRSTRRPARSARWSAGRTSPRASSTSPPTGPGGRRGARSSRSRSRAAMEDHISLNSFWDGPPQITITDPRCKNADGTPWQPSNAADEGAGAMSLTNATAFSVNTIFAQLVTVVGPDAVVDVANRMGITTPLQPVLLDHPRHPAGPPARHGRRLRDARRPGRAPPRRRPLWRVRPADGDRPVPGRPDATASQVLRRRTTPTS